MHYLEGLRKRGREADAAKRMDALLIIDYPDQIGKDLAGIFEKMFGKYGLNTLLRWGDRTATRHAKEFRSRTLPFDILADIDRLVAETNTLCTSLPTDEDKLQAIEELIVKLNELLADHLVLQGNATTVHYDLDKLYRDCVATLDVFKKRLNPAA